MARYNPQVFNVRNIPDAKRIILTDEDSSTDERWKKETPYFAEMIVQHLGLQERHRVLDFGCGVGRLAKEMIDATGCSVVGADTSVSMRSLAPAYVLSDRFLSCAPRMLPVLEEMHHAVSVWALQHIPDLDNAIGVIHQQLHSRGKLFVVNNYRRAIPTDDGWHDDGKSVRSQLLERFAEVEYGALDAERTTPETAKSAFWGVYQRRL